MQTLNRSKMDTLPTEEEIQAAQEGRRIIDPSRKIRALFYPADYAKKELGDDTWQKIQGQMATEADPAGAMQRFANMNLLRLATKLPARDVAQKYEFLKEHYAREFLGHDGPISDSEFYAKQAGKFTSADSRAEFLSQSIGQMIEGIENAKASWEFTSEARNKMKDNPAFQDDGWDETMQAISDQWKFLESRKDQMATEIEEAARYIGSGDDSQLQNFQSLSTEDQELAAYFASARMKRRKPKEQPGIVSGVVKSVGRGVRQSMLSTGEDIQRELGGLPFVKDAKTTRSKQLIENIANSEYDPLNEKNWSDSSYFSTTYWRGALNSAAQSTFRSAIATNPVGLAVGFMANRSDIRQQLQRDYGVDERIAAATSTVLAVPMSALDYVEGAAIFGKYGRSNPIAMMKANLMQRSVAALRVFGTTVATEIAAEKLQNEIPKIGAEFLEQIKQTNVPVDWEAQDIVNGLKEISGPALLFGLVGSGAASFDSRRIRRQALQDVKVLRRVGYTPEDIESLMEAGSLQEFQDKVRAYHDGARELMAIREENEAIQKQLEQGLAAIGEIDVAGRGLVFVEPKHETEFAKTRHPEAAKAFEEQRADTSVFVELKNAEGETVPGIVSGYWIDGVPNVGIYDGGAFTDGPLPQGWEILTPVTGKEEWLTQKTPTPPKYSVNRNQSGQLEVRTLEGEVVTVAKSPDLAARAIQDHAAGRMKTIERQVPDTVREQMVEPDGLPTDEGAIQPPAPPQQAHPDSDSPVPRRDYVALTKDEMNMIREEAGASKLDKGEQEKWAFLAESAKSKGMVKSAADIARASLAEGRTPNREEVAAFALHARELILGRDNAALELSRAEQRGDRDAAERYKAAIKVMNSDLEAITDAASNASTEAGRSLNLFRMAVKLQDGSIEQLRNAYEIAAKKNPDPEVLAHLERIANDMAVLRQQITKLEEKVAAEQAEAFKQNAQEYINEGIKRRSDAVRKTAPERRRRALDRLKSLGYRLGAVAGQLTREHAVAIADLADSIIDEFGVTKIADLTERIKAYIPDVSDSNIYYSVGRLVSDDRKKLEDEAKRRKKDLQKQARIMAKIDDIMQGKAVARKLKLFDSEEVKDLKRQLFELRRSAYETTHDQRAIESLEATLTDIEDMIETGRRNKPKEKELANEEVEALKEKVNQARSLLRTIDAIADLNEQIKSGKFKVDAPIDLDIKEREDLTRKRIELKKLRQEANELIERDRKRGPLQWLAQGMSEVRAIKATADASVLLMQGMSGVAHLARRNPQALGRIVWNSFRSATSALTAREIMDGIEHHPQYPTWVKDGLFLSDFDGVISGREESFTNLFVQKLKGVKAAERLSVVFLNMLRVSMYQSFLDKCPDATKVERKAMAKFVNWSTGRGSLGRAEAAAQYLNIAFFSARFAVSRWQYLMAPVLLKDAGPRVRKEILTNMFETMALGSAFLAVLALAGGDVETDPKKRDFGMARFRGHSFSVWGGMRSVVRLWARMALAVYENVQYGASDEDMARIAMDYIKYKASPGVAAANELLTGRNMMGREVTGWEIAQDLTAPIILEQITDSWRAEEDIRKTAAATALSFVGAESNVD